VLIVFFLYLLFDLFFTFESAAQSTQQITATVAPPVVAPGEDPKPEVITQPILDLYRRKGWEKKQVVEQCQFEDLSVEFCDKKAIRITTEVKCSLQTFKSFLGDLAQLYKYDPQLKSHEVMKHYGNGASVLYTAYKVPAAMIAARDFCTLNSGRELSAEEEKEYGFAPPGEIVFVQCSLDEKLPHQKENAFNFSIGLLLLCKEKDRKKTKNNG